jgi:hypothetical protein
MGDLYSIIPELFAHFRQDEASAESPAGLSVFVHSLITVQIL